MADMVIRVTHPAPSRVRAAAAALAVAGILFALYPALRPYTDETTLAGARAFASTAWVVSHALGMLGFIGLAIGLVGVHIAQRGIRDGARSFWALLMTWTGAGLVLTYYGAEAFGLRVIGRLAVQSGDAGLLDLAHQIRFRPGVVLFGAGLVLLAAGGIMTAVTAWHDHRLVRWGGVLTGICLALYLPQFFGPPPVRVAHGVLLAVGCLWLAAGLWIRRAAAPVTREPLARAVPAPRAPYRDGAASDSLSRTDRFLIPNGPVPYPERTGRSALGYPYSWSVVPFLTSADALRSWAPPRGAGHPATAACVS